MPDTGAPAPPAPQGHIPVFEIVVVRALVSTLVTSLSCRAGGVPLFGRTAPQALLIARGVIGGTAMTVRWGRPPGGPLPVLRGVSAARVHLLGGALFISQDLSRRKKGEPWFLFFLGAAMRRWCGYRWQTRCVGRRPHGEGSNDDQRAPPWGEHWAPCCSSCCCREHQPADLGAPCPASLAAPRCTCTLPDALSAPPLMDRLSSSTHAQSSLPCWPGCCWGSASRGSWQLAAEPAWRAWCSLRR